MFQYLFFVCFSIIQKNCSLNLNCHISHHIQRLRLNTIMSFIFYTTKSTLQVLSSCLELKGGRGRDVGRAFTEVFERIQIVNSSLHEQVAIEFQLLQEFLHGSRRGQFRNKSRCLSYALS